MTPAWALRAVEQWIHDRQSGDLTFVFRNGEIKHIRRQTITFPPSGDPVTPKASPGPPCPTCGESMEERDYGNSFLCRCGTKRTRTQMAKATEKNG